MANRRINKPQHIRQVLNTQINRITAHQEKEELSLKEEIEIGRAIAYMSTVALTAMKDGELEERMTAIEKALKEGV